MYNPVSTYRIQFHNEFTFKDLEEIIPYLLELGITTLYASPIFEAVPGSNHGYDVVNPHRINPEIGTLAELRRISKKLKAAGIGWLQDIVPNHMAFHDTNSWLMDVLEQGQESAYAGHFDILWDAPVSGGRLMVPFLGASPEEVIQNGQLKIVFQNGGFKFAYGEQAYPLNLESSLAVLKQAEQSGALNKLAKITDLNALKAGLSNPVVKKQIKPLLDKVNGQPELLLGLADGQYYRLSYWKDSETEMNYRRFFTVNGLICLNIQDPAVFDDYHQLIKTLLDDGVFQGLRVDHIDGLYDPLTYLQRLRSLAGEEVYIVVEKILEEGEKFPADWPVQGSTGYDFLALVNNLFTAAEHKRVFTDFYHGLASDKQTISRSILEKKANILYQHMAGELENLYRIFAALKPAAPEIEPALVKAAIAEFLIRCPVYRYYGNSLPLSAEESNAVENILTAVSRAKPLLAQAVRLLHELWLKPPGRPADRAAALHFYQRCMQFSGPLMAKGVEDTLMYTYSRFIGHNEVGDSPAAFGIEIAGFHQLMLERREYSPLSLNATATHDTKRGEDVRVRLNSLTAAAGDWLRLVAKWQREHRHLKTAGAPDNNDEYLVYQTLAGFYPFPGGDDSDIEERLRAYLTKALREAKIHTQWAEPDTAYETATLDFAVKLLDRKGSFWKSFAAFRQQIADQAVINSLAQTLLKFTCPGVPDVYQGTELWDLSLVDPDNRRPVDYHSRQGMLAAGTDVKTLWEDRYNGNIKLFLTRLLLRLRKDNPALFTGDYIPLQVKGKYRTSLIAFARQHLREWLIVVAPLRPVKGGDWKDTAIILPESAPLQWHQVIHDRPLIIDGEVPVRQLFDMLPLAVLKSVTPANRRSAGVIMHITSLPSTFGIGDLGPQARSFADFLARTNQRYWQLLPLNPTGPAAGNSPYSAFSSMAGNSVLISPEELYIAGLLTGEELKRYEVPAETTVDFERAYRGKQQLLTIAFERFKSAASEADKARFADFCKNEADWLADFALYEVLKATHNDKPWYDWPDEFRCREKQALRSVAKHQALAIERSKWLQYQFFEQWSALRTYGNERGIQFFGDLPFYVSYDSADVWTHPQLFKLNNNKEMAGIAGVPPDYFNASGQLWGMPVYDWQALAGTGYKWWVDRIRKNMEYFDVLRLDHFRAFYDYWEVPAGETTAVNGSWQPGPGTALFRVLEEQLGRLPFIAEDLGDVSPGVYALRDELNLPGMNLLQYAFGADMPVSVHIPHNHRNHSVTYTGTHDNNTTAGWFTQDATATERANLAAYIRSKVTVQNVHDLLTGLCYASPAEIAIVPLQDLLGLDGSCRMNMPSSGEGNWSWRLQPGQLTNAIEIKLRKLVDCYNR
jgi:malto-oligosyltrehalose synthase/4-alpha-glucanotransferase